MQELDFNPLLSNAILDYYIDNNIGNSEMCKKCRSFSIKKGRKLENGPIPFFHIGGSFQEGEIRPLFVGIVAYGWEGELDRIFFSATKEERFKNKSNVIYAIENRIDDLFFYKRKFHLDEKKMKYFSYIRSAVENVYGQNGYSKIALTNLLKCNDGSVRSSGYLQKCFDFCIYPELASNLMKEIEIIKPTHVILMSKNHNRFYRYMKLIEQIGVQTMTIAHPSSNKSGTIIQWSNKIREFLT